MPVTGDNQAGTGPSIDQIVSQMQGRGVTQGWDVVIAQSARVVNELFQRQFVAGLATREQLLTVSGTVPVVENISVELTDVVLGPPEVSFDPAKEPQSAAVTIPLISGLAQTTTVQGDVTSVLAVQWITAADGYAITGWIPLGTLTGKVEHQTEVVLRINDGKGFFAKLSLDGAAGTVLGTYFLDVLKDNASQFDYRLGSLSYAPGPYDLIPASGFEIATQKDLNDPADAGRVLLFVPTTYNPDGGHQTVLPVANVVPAGMDVALLVSGNVLFGHILRDALQSALSSYHATVTAQPTLGDVWSATVAGGVVTTDAIIDKSSWNGAYWSGWCQAPSLVSVNISGLTLSATDGQLTAHWSATLDQPWAHTYVTLIPPTTCDNERIHMDASIERGYAVAVDPVTAVLSFTAQSGGVQVSYTSGDSSILETIFKDAGAADKMASKLAGNILAALQPIWQFQVPQVGAFAVTNLLFPDQNVVRLSTVRLPADLVAFGTLQASKLTVAPAMAIVATGQTVAFTASALVTWSASAGQITAAGAYTAPARVARSQVVVITATGADGTKAYAAALVTPAQVQVAPVIHVLQAGGVRQKFAASMPGATTRAAWSVSPAIGQVDAVGQYTPPATVTTPTVVTLTAAFGSATGTARIVVFPTLPVGVQVTPRATTPLGPGGVQPFTATMDGKPTAVTWSLLPPVGTVDGAGTYTAPATVDAPQAVLVVATSTISPTIGGTAVVLLGPVGGWASAPVAGHRHHASQDGEDGL
jgi:hypothetical protein